ncbi:MAG: 3'-5' exonuclease [Bacillota bacterium]|nr:3'-5' exonuclease [Bacillota bacterium]NLJ03570.1 3'-5' exonuclease [Bacillota bacterium]
MVFFDVETTGLDGYRDRIIEIFMLSLSKRGEVEEYGTLINPERPLPEKITEITGLRDSDLAHAPAEREVAAEIREFVGHATPVAHNLSFDLRFLNSMFKRNNLLELVSGGIDTLSISRALFPKLCIYPQGGGSHRLSNLMYHFGLQDSYANSHRAKDDVMLLVEVFRCLQDYASGKSGISFPEAAIQGCPACGSAMYVEYQDGQTILSCKKQPSCAAKLVV